MPETEAVELEEDEYFDWQLAGCEVETIDGERDRHGSRADADRRNGSAGRRGR